jgi:hypothetical protein
MDYRSNIAVIAFNVSSNNVSTSAIIPSWLYTFKYIYR